MSEFIAGAFITILIYELFIRPRSSASAERRAFDRSVTAFVEGIIAGYDPDYFISDLKSYVLDQLSIAHSLPNTSAKISYKPHNGFEYHGYVGHNDHCLFAVIAIAKYAFENGDSSLLSYAESMLEPSRRMSMTRW